jgi:hypothetical protein
MTITNNYTPQNVPFTAVDCASDGSATGDLNHFEVRISAARVEIWATDAGSATLKQIAFANIIMPLTRGFISLEDVHFDAGKFNTQRLHTFGWDNVGFDGPKLYRNVSFDVQDALVTRNNNSNVVALGYSTPLTVNVPGVSWYQQPTQAAITFNWFPYGSAVPSVRLNGGAWHEAAWPFDPGPYTWRTISVNVPLSELRASTNTIDFVSNTSMVVSNIDIVLTAASPVP